MSRKLTNEMIARVKTDAAFRAELSADADAVFAKTSLYPWQQRDVLNALAAHASNASKTKKSAPDKLTKIEGIGPKAAGVLAEAGIASFAALAESTPAQLKHILTAAGGRFNAMVPDTWPEQAALANAGNWAELKTLQDALDGGKRK